MIKKFVIGIDEAGRGPLAGPVSVGVVLVPTEFNWDLIPGVGDSKQLSEKKREIIFHRAIELQKSGQLQYKVGMVAAKIIDKKGIVFAINVAMKTALDSVLNRPCLFKIVEQARPVQGFESSTRRDLVLDEIMVKLDGGLRAPVEFLFQETIIKGDAKEKVIGLASIMAKVTRDRYMETLAEKPSFEVYNFARHKGYGTKVHREAIAQNGLSTEHRASYCKNIEMC